LSLAHAAAADNALVREGRMAQVRALRRELAGDDAPPLERLLAQRVALCWLALHYAETVYAQAMGELSLRQADFHQRRISAAQGRYLAAIRALAAVRRLGV